MQTPTTTRPLADYLLAAEAFLLLALFRIFLALFPVRRILRTITRTQPRSVPEHPAAWEAPAAPGHPALASAHRIQWAVEAVARNAPAAFVCFPQTLAGYTMLRRRNIASVMVYGVARSPAGDLIAHTWLTVGDRIVLGGEGSGAFTPIDHWT